MAKGTKILGVFPEKNSFLPESNHAFLKLPYKGCMSCQVLVRIKAKRLKLKKKNGEHCHAETDRDNSCFVSPSRSLERLPATILPKEYGCLD